MLRAIYNGASLFLFLSPPPPPPPLSLSTGWLAYLLAGKLATTALADGCKRKIKATLRIARELIGRAILRVQRSEQDRARENSFYWPRFKRCDGTSVGMAAVSLPVYHSVGQRRGEREFVRCSGAR